MTSLEGFEMKGVLLTKLLRKGGKNVVYEGMYNEENCIVKIKYANNKNELEMNEKIKGIVNAPAVLDVILGFPDKFHYAIVFERLKARTIEEILTEGDKKVFDVVIKNIRRVF